MIFFFNQFFQLGVGSIDVHKGSNWQVSILGLITFLSWIILSYSCSGHRHEYAVKWQSGILNRTRQTDWWTYGKMEGWWSVSRWRNMAGWESRCCSLCACNSYSSDHVHLWQLSQPHTGSSARSTQSLSISHWAATATGWRTSDNTQGQDTVLHEQKSKTCLKRMFWNHHAQPKYFHLHH